MSSAFHNYESRDMSEITLKILSIFTVFSDTAYETLLRRGSFETKKTYLFNSMLIYLLLINR